MQCVLLTDIKLNLAEQSIHMLAVRSGKGLVHSSSKCFISTILISNMQSHI